MPKLTPVGEFRFPEPGPDMFRLTCKNHPTAEYSTKNPFLRGLHIIKYPDGMGGECSCPFSDLMVVEETEQEKLEHVRAVMEEGRKYMPPSERSVVVTDTDRILLA